MPRRDPLVARTLVMTVQRTGTEIEGAANLAAKRHGITAPFVEGRVADH